MPAAIDRSGRLAVPAPVDRRGAPVALVVDDQPMVRMAMVRMLRTLGFDVVEAAGALEALDLASATVAGIDVLVTDVMMPGMSGGQLATLMNARHPSLPILFVSGYAEDPELDTHLRRSGTSYLQKPFTMGELREQVEGLLSIA